MKDLGWSRRRWDETVGSGREIRPRKTQWDVEKTRDHLFEKMAGNLLTHTPTEDARGLVQGCPRHTTSSHPAGKTQLNESAAKLRISTELLE